jgi:prepilin peptidase CpaA
MNFIQQELTSTASALLCACIGSIHDVRTRKIPNTLCGPAMVAGIAMHAAWGGWRGASDSIFAGICAGAIALLFWFAGGMGAGDVKLVAAVGCIAGTAPLAMVLMSTAVAGGMIALAISIYHGRLREALRNAAALVVHHQREGLKPHPELNVDSANANSLPFALPVAAGCLATLCSLVWEAHS